MSAEQLSAEQRLASLGLTLPPPPVPIGNYVPFRLAGNLLFLPGSAHADRMDRRSSARSAPRWTWHAATRPPSCAA